VTGPSSRESSLSRANPSIPAFRLRWGGAAGRLSRQEDEFQFDRLGIRVRMVMVSAGLSFQCLTGSLMRAANRRCCSA
jgi:hypothetical protein